MNGIHGSPDRIVAGVDEAGRGPWAGPVVAAAVIFPNALILHPDLTDSKAISAKKRESLYEWIVIHGQVGIGQAEADEIDSINIRQATLLAMKRAVDALDIKPHHVIVDGRDALSGDFTSEAIIKGDASEPAISAASIIAKVTRDRLMAGYALLYPQYGFEKNQGYGTAIHQVALEQYGVCPIHRLSYRPVKECLSVIDNSREQNNQLFKIP